MNHIYRSIWNAMLGCWVAAPETARAASAGSASCVLAAPATPRYARLGWRATALALAAAAWLPGVAMAVPVGPYIDVGGDVQNAGIPVATVPASPWNLGSSALGVGVNSVGLLFLHDGATVTSGSVSLGQNSGSFGWLTVDGLGSRLTTQGLYVGYVGDGQLNITNGGAVSSAYAQVSNASTSNSTVTVQGAGSTWTNSGALLLGVHGTGTLTIEQGGLVQTDTITLGSGTPATAHGILNLNGNAVNGRGVLEATQVTKGAGTSTLSINGGILRASAHQSDFLKGFTALTLGAEGAYFDTNGYNIGLGTAFASAPGGGLFKQGAGTLTLRGASTYNGGTTISEGTLVAAHASALGTGDVTVSTGAALEVASGTTLAVGGDLTFQSESTYRVYAGPNGSTSSVHASGTATLAGSVLHVGPKSDFAVATPYAILTANGGLNGTVFSGVSSSYAFLNAKLDYSANDVILTLQGVEDFGARVNTGNQQAVARNVQMLGTGNSVYDFLVQTSDAEAGAVANALSGDSHANWQSGLQAVSARASGLGPQRMHSNLTAGYRPGAAIAQSDGPLPASAWPTSKALPAWAEVVGHRQSIDGDSNAAKLTQNVYGLFVGADEEVGSNGWRVGGSLGFTTADAKVKARDASADTKSYSASVYTGKGFSHGMNRVNVLGGLAYTHHRISSERSVATQNLKAKYSANTLQLFGEVGYAMGQYSKQGVEPFAGINISQQRVGGFQESGGFAALRGSSSNDTTTSTTLGVRAHSDFKLAGKDARVKGTVGGRHAFGDVKQTATMAFEGSSSFTVTGAPLARNTALLGLQAEVELSRSTALEFGYQGEYGSGSRDHAVNVKMRWAY